MTKTKKLLPALIGLALCSAAPAAFSEGYASLNIGAAAPSITSITDPADPTIDDELTMKRGLALGGAVGFEMDQFRFEAELARRMNDPDKYKFPGGSLNLTGGDFKTDTLLVNGYYTFSINSPIKPFVTAGIGAARVKANGVTDGVDTLNDTATGLAYQVGAGAEYELTDTVSLEAKYRYLGVKDLDFGGLKNDAKSHEVFAGIRIKM